MARNSINTFGMYRASRAAQARAQWRDTARTVAQRWDAFLRSEPESRSFAFASYVAAVDAEEAAAAEMSRLLPATAAYGTSG